jgi:hypothetical protein
MLAVIALLAAAADAPAAAPPAASDPMLNRMVALYDEVCLKAFPSDSAVDAAMAARGARALTAEEAHVTLHDDPGRGWLLEDGGRTAQVMLELPPYHACSVRWMTPAGFDDQFAYRLVTNAYKTGHPGFGPPQPAQGERGGYRISAVMEVRQLPDGGADNLMIIEQRIADPARVAAGETAVSLRFVHQLAPPGSPPG